MTEPDTLQQVGRTSVRWKNRTLTYFAGCDYFRLARHPQVAAALRNGLRQYGPNVAASRLTTGNHSIYEKLEAALAGFFAAPTATLLSNGYAAAPVAAQALAGQFTRVLMDERSHPSLRDASLQFRCPVETFAHRDPAALHSLIARASPGDKLILLTDGLFAHSGEVAPLREYLEILPASGLILVDDAHAAGLLGKKGRGTPEYTRVARDRIIQTLSLSKAFGAFGGVILGSRALRENIIQKSPMFAGSTPLPPPLAAAALQSLELLRRDSRLRERLDHNIQHVQAVLRQRDFPVPAAPTPIISCPPFSPGQNTGLRRRLLARGIFPSFIQYPGGPAAGYFRFTYSSAHTRSQLNALLSALHPK